MSRICTLCREPIPANRLAAIPNAAACVSCIESSGDVQTIKRYDEATREGMVATYYHDSDTYVKAAHRHQNIVRPSDEAFMLATGDDQFLVRAGTPRSDRTRRKQ